MTKTMTILTIFLLLLLPFSAIAEGNIKVLDKNGNDITHDNHEEVKEEHESSEEGGSENTTGTNGTTSKKESKGITEDSIKAAQTAYEGALNGFTESIINAMYEGSVNIFETDIEAEEDGTITYNIQVRKLDPYEHPLVLPMQLISFCFLIIITIITILGSMLLAAFQERRPEQYGDLIRSLTGKYLPYHPSRVHTACVWSIIRPVRAFLLFLIILIVRNFLLTSMPQTASGVLGAATDNIIIRAITGASIFMGSIQTSMGEYGVYTFGALIFIVYIITDIIVLANAPDIAKKIELVFWGAFGLFCFCDIVNMFCTSFGVITSQWRGESIFITVGIMAGAGINFILLGSLAVFAILKGKKALGV